MITSTNVILHAFNWKFNEIKGKAAKISEFGYKFVLVSPVVYSVGEEWWEKYQPKDYRILLSSLGNKKDLIDMVTALNSKGIEVIVDIVLNHMANEERDDKLDFPGKKFLEEYKKNSAFYEQTKLYGDLKNNLFSSLDFHSAFCIYDYNDPYSVHDGRLCGLNGDEGLPDLKGNDWIIQQQQILLTKLKELGVRGFRIDAAKHMPTSQLNSVFTDSIKQNMFIFGEVIDESIFAPPPFLEDYLKETDHCALDFPLHDTIKNAFKPWGKLIDLVNPLERGTAVPDNRSVTFVISHDYANNGNPENNGNVLETTDEQLGYAYILGKDGGVPIIYSDKGKADKLLTDRWKDAYKNPTILKMIEFHNRTHGAKMQFIDKGNCFLLFRRDNLGIVGINKCDTEIRTTISTEGLFWHRDYRDLITGTNIINISDHQHEIVIPKRSARMWVLS